jgi:hypothetical protein
MGAKPSKPSIPPWIKKKEEDQDYIAAMEELTLMLESKIKTDNADIVQLILPK